MSKLFDGLRQIDRFADVVSLTLNGRKSHGTRIGGCLTVVLFLTVLAYWGWGTHKCFTYYQPQVFTTNVPLPTETPPGLNVTMGGSQNVYGQNETDQPKYISIVFGSVNSTGDYTFYNSTNQTIDG
jgi:hypothetical protein